MVERDNFEALAMGLHGLNVRLAVPNPGDYSEPRTFIQIAGLVEEFEGTKIRLQDQAVWVDLLECNEIEVYGLLVP